MFSLYERFADEASKGWAKFVDEKILEYFTKVHGRSTVEEIMEFANRHKCDLTEVFMPMGELQLTFSVNDVPQFDLRMDQEFDGNMLKFKFSSNLEQVIEGLKS